MDSFTEPPFRNTGTICASCIDLNQYLLVQRPTAIRITSELLPGVEKKIKCSQVWMPGCPAHGRYRMSSGPQPGAHVEGLRAKMTPMYGPAVRCKRFRRSWRCGLASMYPASDWSALCSEPSWISARVRSHYRIGLERAVGVTSVHTRREDRSSIVVSSSRRPRRANLD